MIKAELNVVALIARKNVSFNFLDSLLQTLHGIAGDSKAVKGMTRNRTKGTYLLTECLAVYAHEQLVAALKKASGFSILCDKATDITMKKVFCVNVRYLEKETCQPVTRLYSLIPVEEGNAEGLFKCLQETLQKDELPWTKVLGYASDGENLMQGANDSVLTGMEDAAPGLFILKCYCHTFHLVAEHASKILSKTAEQLIHDVYNYFKLSPNRQKSLIEFQKFVKVDVHKILKPCQTRWLSVVTCVQRILEQWPALELFFVAEVAEANSTQAERILSALKSPYVKATLEFSEFVLGDLTGLNLLFQSNSFRLHALLPELERVLRMLHNNFMKIDGKEALATVNVNDERKWVPLEQVYPGYMAAETVKEMLPHQRESFLTRCRDWCREAIRQIRSRVDISDPLLSALQDVSQARISKSAASIQSAGVLAKGLPRITTNLGISIQTIDREWRSLLIDSTIKEGGWETKEIVKFWQGMQRIPAYVNVASFMLEVTALPQSTAEVKRTFSKVNANKTKLRSSLSVSTLQGILRSNEHFPSTFAVDARLTALHGNARLSYMARFQEEERKTFEIEEDFD